MIKRALKRALILGFYISVLVVLIHVAPSLLVFLLVLWLLCALVS